MSVQPATLARFCEHHLLVAMQVRDWNHFCNQSGQGFCWALAHELFCHPAHYCIHRSSKPVACLTGANTDWAIKRVMPWTVGWLVFNLDDSLFGAPTGTGHATVLKSRFCFIAVSFATQGESAHGGLEPISIGGHDDWFQGRSRHWQSGKVVQCYEKLKETLKLS